MESKPIMKYESIEIITHHNKTSPKEKTQNDFMPSIKYDSSILNLRDAELPIDTVAIDKAIQ